MIAETSDESWRDLVDRLATHDVRYLLGGSAWDGKTSPYLKPEDAALVPLLLDLARAPEARLRTSLVALLLRHPEYAFIAEATARRLGVDDSARRLLLVSIVIAAALQSEWSFAMDLYLLNAGRIEADHLAAEFDLPVPAIDYGRPSLAAAADLLRRRAAFPFNFEADWENAAHRLRRQLAIEARQRGS
jgi:hypothetical protein